MSNPPEATPYRPGYQIATQKILEYIQAHELKVGDRLPTERQLAEIIGVSHAVAREAVKVLFAVGKISVRKRAGLFVAEPDSTSVLQPDAIFLPSDPGQVRQLFEYRALIEGQAAQLAAVRATPPRITAIKDYARLSSEAAASGDFAQFRSADQHFHDSIAAASGNMFIAGAATAINGLKKDVLHIGLHDSASGSMVDAAQQHDRIAEAIARGDSDAALALSLEHIEIAKSQYLSRITAILQSMGTPDLA
ncbi:FadR/GntR family transcriptional regulator [Psychromicrobium xiongbiense]|uniref:FadR/GntR family transcriptional regulator n=1 Tax=Psychromicrobium xiongbiense TaxID=3051184 RepID=UPI002552FCEB|nr:FCD domain-containing protein [Psychromicrobium sp. YIM S02556]